MKTEELKVRNPESEFVFSTSRSGGPGGQNVNKVNTRVELRVNINNSVIFSSEEKQILKEKLKNRISKEGELIISSQSARTQLMNRKKVIEKFYVIITEALTTAPERKSTKPTLTSRARRVEKKRARGYLKRLRKDKGRSSMYSELL